MRMKYEVRNVGDVAVLDLSGHISPGRTVADRLVLHDLVTEQVRSGHNKLLLNLGEVSFIDSAGIGDLIGALRVVQSHGGQMHICGASSRVGDLLYRTHLDSIIHCYSNEASALREFSVDGNEKASA